MTRPASDVLADLAACAQRQAELTAELAPALRALVPAPAQAEVPAYLTPAEAARVLGVSERTLRSLRASGRGPRYIRLGQVVRYVTAELTSNNAAAKGTAR